MRILLVATGAVLAGLLTACAQTHDQPIAHPPAPVAIDSMVPFAMATVHANGMAVAVVDAGQVVYARAFGRRNEIGEPLRNDTVMVGASLTKPVFAHLVMQLSDEGRIDLDVPIARYLPQPLPSYPTQRPYPAWHSSPSSSQA